jgi:hypothetical protein
MYMYMYIYTYLYICYIYIFIYIGIFIYIYIHICRRIYQVFTFNTTIGRCQPPTKYIEKYNPATNKWTVEADMLFGRSDTAVGVLDNDMFVIGGEMSQVR